MGSEAKARLGLWFVLAVTLIGFNQLFASGDFPGPILLGMLVASAVAIAGRRLGLSGIVTVLISSVVLLWYLGLVFKASETFWSLPTQDSLAALWRSAGRALEHSNTDFAPVPLRTGYLVIVVAAMWAAATVGELAMFRSHRPLLAGLLPVVTLAVVLTVGTGAGAGVLVLLMLAALLTMLGLENAHRLRSWGRWMPATEGRRSPDRARAPSGDLARKMGTATLLSAMVAPLFLPALQQGLVSWRTGTGGGGNGTGGRVNPWVSIVPDIPNQTDAELFKVEARDDAYWRIASLEVFDGQDWAEARRDRVPAEGGSIGGPAFTPGATRELMQTLTVTGLEGEFLPAATAPVLVERLDSDGPWDGIDYDPDSGSVLLDEDLGAGQRFRITSGVADIDYDDLRQATPGRPGELADTYFEVPATLQRAEVDELIDRWTKRAETPFERLVAIQDRLRSFDYDLGSLPAEGTDYVADFLLNTRSGFCQQFSTAFAVVARQLGFPSRVSVGFLPGERNELTRTFTVRGTDAHAWPEVFFEGYGWIPFEPTPRSESFAPTYTLAPAIEGSGPLGGGLTLNNPFSDTGRGGEQLRETGGADIDPELGAAAAEREDRRARRERARALAAAEWQKTFSRILAVLAGAVILFLIAAPALKEARIRRRYGRVADANDLATAAFAHFDDEAAELASRRRAGESAIAFARRLSGAGTVSERTAMRLAEIFEAAAYAGTSITREQGMEAKRLAAALRSQLWGQASWWARAQRLFALRRVAL